MAHALEVLVNIASIVASFLGNKYVGASATVMAGLGVLPRAGPMRALVLGASSKVGFLRPSFTASQRAAECQALKEAIDAAPSFARYIVVTGPKGVGKTTIINTVAAELPGVVRVRVTTKASEDEIVSKTLKAVTRFQFTFMDPAVGGATRVVNWHKRFFRVPPTVILQVAERTPGTEPAPMGSIVRDLVDTHKLRVIVDSSDSSLDEMALTTRREDVIPVGLMKRDELESIPELEELLTALKTAGEADLVWGVFGGNPASYFGLCGQWMKPGKKDIVSVVDAFVRTELKTATKTFNGTKASHRHLVGPIYDQFKTVDELPASIREEFVLPFPDKVLRLVATENGEDDVLVPSSPAMALVMRYSVGGKTPTVEVVRKALVGAK